MVTDGMIKKKKKIIKKKQIVEPKEEIEVKVESDDDAETLKVEPKIEKPELLKEEESEQDRSPEDDSNLDLEQDPEVKQRKSGVVYFPEIPPGFNVTKMTNLMNEYTNGLVGRVLFVPIERSGDKDKKKKRAKSLKYKEGWMEFKKKSVAKRLVASLNGMPIQVKKLHVASGLNWLCKYLPGFKWVHLKEQMAYEKKANMQRMKMEIQQAKRVADHFSEQIEKGRHLRKLEEKVLKKGGLWDKFQRDITQRKTKAQNQKKGIAKANSKPDDELMKMIFAE